MIIACDVAPLPLRLSWRLQNSAETGGDGESKATAAESRRREERARERDGEKETFDPQFYFRSGRLFLIREKKADTAHYFSVEKAICFNFPTSSQSGSGKDNIQTLSLTFPTNKFRS